MSGVVPFGEPAFWESFPLLDDAELVPVAQGVDIGFATGMIELELFDFYFYAAWLPKPPAPMPTPTP